VVTHVSLLKYKDLVIEIQCMWNVKVKVIPVSIGELKPSQNHSDKTSKTYQESTKSRNYTNNDIWHCTHTSESANVKTQNAFQVRNGVTCSRNGKYGTAAILYTLETWSVSGI
jgi:hypothetical protein